MNFNKYLSPFRHLHTDLDQFLQGPNARRGAFDLTENETAFELTMDVPGFTSDDLSIAVEGRVLQLRGQRQMDSDDTGKRYHNRTRTQMTFEESIRFPVDIDVDSIVADMKDGVLTLTLPKVKPAGARRVEVQPNTH